MTWVFPKFNMIILISLKEISKFFRDSWRLDLIQVDQWVKNSFCHIYRVCNDYDVIYIDYLGGLIYAISNSEEFSLIRSDVDTMMKNLDDRFIMYMYMSNWYCNLIFNACIGNNNSSICFSQHLEYKFIKLVIVYFYAFFVFSIY